MKVRLLNKNRDFIAGQALPANVDDLAQDLELELLFDSMANGDEFLYKIAKDTVLHSLNNATEIRYRQGVLKDCLKNQDIVKEIYQLTIDSIENKRKGWLGFFTHYPSEILNGSNRLMSMFFTLLKKLRKIADEHADDFESEGFADFFKMIRSELTDAYFDVVDYHLKNLEFREGVLISAKLGKGNEGTEYVLRLPGKKKKFVQADFFEERQFLRILRRWTRRGGNSNAYRSA